MPKIKRAIISVSDKKGIVAFAYALNSMGVEIISTGGTASKLRSEGFLVQEVVDVTGSPEMLDGRVKTLHPKVHGGLLARRDLVKDMDELKKYGIDPIDMVVVNLYPFEETISKPGVTFDDAIENIDIGGPTMLRSASKNFKDVVPIVNPADYPLIIAAMRDNDGDIPYNMRMRLARDVFQHTYKYDQLITDYLTHVLASNASAEGV